MLHADITELHLPTATAGTFASNVPTTRVAAATGVKWKGQVETRVRYLLIMTAGKGRKWGDVVEYAEVLVPADGDSSDEGLLVDDHSEPDGSAGHASSDGARSHG